MLQRSPSLTSSALRIHYVISYTPNLKKTIIFNVIIKISASFSGKMIIPRGFNSLRALMHLSRENIVARTFATLPPEVVIFPDPEMVVCWHPEQNFPYECSKPLPEVIEPPYSVLNIGSNETKVIFSRKKNTLETAQEMAKITYTTMHPWFPRSRDKKAKKTKPDRPYL